MIAKGQAAFMIMGDWQIGIFTAAGLKTPQDYQCAQAPTDWGKPGFILNSDSVVFFKQKDPDYVAGQTLLAHLIMSPKFQTVFNEAKGSIPARLDIDLKDFNPCQQQSQKDLAGLDRRRHAGALDGPQHDHPAEVSRRDPRHHHRLRQQPENDAGRSRQRHGGRRRRAKVSSPEPVARRLSRAAGSAVRLNACPCRTP